MNRPLLPAVLTRPMTRFSVARFSVALAFFTLTSSALASPSFPSVLQSTWGTPCVPDCSLCHTANPPVATSATQLFGRAVAGRGAKATNDDSLRKALQGIEDGLPVDPVTKQPVPVDSDGDGVLDIDELRGLAVGDSGQLTTNPNVVGDSLAGTTPSNDICGTEPQYGCGNHVAPRVHAHSEGVWLLVVAALAALLFGRRFLARR